MRLNFFVLIFVTAVLYSCSDPSRVFEKNYDLEKYEWQKDQTLVFEFEIKDTMSDYNLSYNIRYTNTFPFYNLYISYILYDSTKKEIAHKNPVGMDLFDPKTGKPLGSGLGDIFDYRVLNRNSIRFPHPGKYKLVASQYMRQDPLPGIVSFGLRLETLIRK